MCGRHEKVDLLPHRDHRLAGVVDDYMPASEAPLTDFNLEDDVSVGVGYGEAVTVQPGGVDEERDVDWVRSAEPRVDDGVGPRSPTTRSHHLISLSLSLTAELEDKDRVEDWIVSSICLR